MPMNGGQIVLVSAVSLYFALQLLPHRLTWIAKSPFWFVYQITFPLGMLFIAFSAIVSFCLWCSRISPARRLKYRNGFSAFALMLMTSFAISAFSRWYARGLPIGSFASTFDSRLWLRDGASDGVYGDITERQKILGDAIKTIVVDGTRESIVAALGPSQDNGYFKNSGRDLIYCTGPARGSMFGIDNEWLLVWFGHDGKTIGFEVRSD